MATFSSKWTALISSVIIGGSALSFAQDSAALLNLLAKKGIISDQEVEDLRAELTTEFAANTSAGKLNLNSSLTEFKISGDVRLRHQYETQAPAFAVGSTAPKVTNERTRERFRFRLNGDAILQKGWGAGFALETGAAADSGNQTFQGSNDDYSIFLARAYVSYQFNRNWLFVGGKQKNPLYTTDLVWDADINPQGLNENYKYFIGAKDTFEVRALQDIMDDRDEKTPGPTGRDAWLFAQQAVYTHWFGESSLSSIVLAPGYMKYSQSVLANGTTNENAFIGTTRALSLFTFAGEMNFANVAGTGTAFKTYWDSSYNFDADTRVRKVYGLSTKSDGSAIDEDSLAWLVGVAYTFGTGKLQGDYSIKLDYRQVGLGSVDVNLNDSDFAFGKLNQEGFKFGVSYNVTDFASLNATYFYTTAMQDNITYTLGNNDHSQLFQLDLVVKF